MIQSNFHFRLPNHVETKQKWIDAIKQANNDNYRGGGLVCCRHFSPDEILGIGRMSKLINGSIPSIFLVEMIQMDEDMAEEDMVKECDDCENLKSEISELKAKLTKFSLDSGIQEMKMLQKNEKLKSKLEERTKENSKITKTLRALETENESLKRKIFVSQTSPNIEVLYYIQMI